MTNARMTTHGLCQPTQRLRQRRVRPRLIISAIIASRRPISSAAPGKLDRWIVPTVGAVAGHDNSRSFGVNAVAISEVRTWPGRGTVALEADIGAERATVIGSTARLDRTTG